MRAKELSCVDYEQGLERFSGNEQLFEKFLKKLAAGDDVETAAELMANGDKEAAYAVIHTLKGTSGNLSINKLYAACSEFTKEYKAGNHNKLPFLLEIIDGEFKKAAEEISKLD